MKCNVCKRHCVGDLRIMGRVGHNDDIKVKVLCGRKCLRKFVKRLQ